MQTGLSSSIPEEMDLGRRRALRRHPPLKTFGFDDADVRCQGRGRNATSGSCAISRRRSTSEPLYRQPSNRLRT